MDIRPKRRKDKDNPYILESNSSNNFYTVKFKDSRGKYQEVLVNKEVFIAFEEFELKDVVQMNEYDRHIEHSVIYDYSINKRAVNKETLVEDQIIKKSTYEELMIAIDKLSDVQQRRIKMYYFDELSTNEIAEKEKCSSHSVRVSIRKAIKELNKILKK